MLCGLNYRSSPLRHERQCRLVRVAKNIEVTVADHGRLFSHKTSSSLATAHRYFFPLSSSFFLSYLPLLPPCSPLDKSIVSQRLTHARDPRSPSLPSKAYGTFPRIPRRSQPPSSRRFGARRTKLCKMLSPVIPFFVEVRSRALGLLTRKLTEFHQDSGCAELRVCSLNTLYFDISCLSTRLTLDTLIQALSKRKDVNNITAVSNNAGVDKRGLGALLYASESPRSSL